MKKIIEENEGDYLKEAVTLKGPIKKVTFIEIIREMKPRSAAEFSKVSRHRVMVKLCQLVLNGEAVSNEWKTSVVVPIFKRKGDAINYGAYTGVKLLEHGTKIFERVVERRISTSVNLDKMQFVLMPGRENTGALYILKRRRTSTKIWTNSCTCVLWIWKKLLIEYQER